MHNDIKLENICIGHHDTDRIYLIDFGMAEKFKNSNGTHIERRNLGIFSGNPLFASSNSCKGYNKSRRDDIESVFYFLIFLLNNNELPWSIRDSDSQKSSDFNFKMFLHHRLQKSST